MITSAVKKYTVWTVLLSAMVMCFTMLSMVSSAKAQTADAPCRAAMILDRSGSVGAFNLQTMREQIRRLFEPLGVYNENIYLAFWSFSADTTMNPRSNYDDPYHDFISSIGVDPGYTNFRTQLNRLRSSGYTNYEQGLAYNYGTPNTFENMEDIVDATDILVFMTDGVPNTPSGQNNPYVGSNNNSFARNIARQAVLRHKANGKTVIGGMVGNASQASLNFVLNGSDSNSSNTFRISTNYDDLAEVLKEEIGDACNPDEPDSDYELVPRTNTNDGVISGSGNATVHFGIDNLSQSDDSEPSAWTIHRLEVLSGEPVDDLETLSNGQGDPYVDGFSCDALRALVDNRASCNAVRNGTGTFSPGDNPLSPITVTLNDQLPVGTRICFVLSIEKPTAQDSPRDRYSNAACILVGKRPLVQVWGGDLYAGRYFANDPISSINPANIRANVVTKPRPGGNQTYGSWSEYGAFATGNVVGFGSMRGLEAGSGSANQASWSTLTFANTQNEFGRFTSAGGSLGTVPNLRDTLLAGRDVDRNLDSRTSIAIGNDEPTGEVFVYAKTNGDLRINESTVGKNRSIIVYVPDDDVTIAGNIDYFPGPYASPSELPQLIIIARSIFINQSVTNVDAWLIADGGIGSGILNTCNHPDLSPTSNDSIRLTTEICNELLKINGPVVAREILLRRTAGANSGGGSGDPAEIFNLRADTYLWAHSASRSELRVQTTFATELPPYF